MSQTQSNTLKADAGQNSAPTISPLSYEEWQNLQTLADNAHEAISALTMALLTASGDAQDPAKAALLKEFERVSPLKDSILPGYFYKPQTEWLGGENECFREPHIANVLPRRIII